MCHQLLQPFNPVVAIPLMKVLCVKKNNTMIGATITTVAAMR
jgi:hypothetical protein